MRVPGWAVAAWVGTGLTGGCAPAGRVADLPAPAAEAAAAPCRVALPHRSTEGWQEVRGEGFTFCVPAGWRGDGGRLWRGAGGRVSWGTGRYRGGRAGLARLAAEGDEARPGRRRAPPAAQAPAPVPHGSRPEEEAAPRRSRLWRHVSENRIVTGAEWPDQGVFLVGEAHTRRVAELQADIFRTLRFTWL